MALHPLRGIALCAGAGGLELGLHVALPGYGTVCWVERDAYAAAALVVRMEEQALDDAPVWSDVTTFDGRPWRGVVDILTAGYPCQPFSTAGLKLGERDPRHLWPHVARIVTEAAPPLVFCENVPGHLDRGFDKVRIDLQGMGYRVEAAVVTAAEVGASHLRARLFFLAYADRESAGKLAGALLDRVGVEVRPGGAPACGPYRGCLLDLPGGAGGEEEGYPALFAPGPDDLEAWAQVLAQSPGLQPAVPRTSDGLAHRMDRGRLVGNGVCSLAAAHALRLLAAQAVGQLLKQES